jgi:hypothetical protein
MGENMDRSGEVRERERATGVVPVSCSASYKSALKKLW